MTTIRTRFAPSPTGHLHIGGARTALFNWLISRNSGGVFVLRIEDTDAERSQEEYTKAILEAMTWLGLDWDEGPFFQTQRLSVHLEYIHRLLDNNRAYWCHCTPDDLTARRQQALEQGGKPKYDGRCRELGLGPAPGAVVRFKGPVGGSTGWLDLIKGPISFDNSELDDLVILKSDGMPTYNMAVVVDDIAMGMTHIVRGDDHVNNTPRQIQLYQALDAPLPQFAHVPMILGSDKTRLSKRHGATSVMAYKEMGYLPEALVNYLARLGWSYGDEEIFSLAELVEKFSLTNVGRSAGVFNPEKLLWLNSHYIKASPPSRLAELVRPILDNKSMPAGDSDYLTKALVPLQPRAKTLVEMAEMVSFFLVDQVDFDRAAAKKFLVPDHLPLMTDLIACLEKAADFSVHALEDVFREFIDRHQIKLGLIAQPLRVALTGKTASPGLFEVMEIMGRDRVLARLRRALDYMAER